ncbi:MAG: lytic transglycosylase domain-containing protein [Acidobacteriales bacterium]|nr:lytic transglycosylase domain-containing protein [Terriglobales bacterium]
MVQERAKSAMEASAQKQRASILKQVTSVTGSSATVAESFFSAPWIEAPAGLTAGSAPCEPLAAPDLEKLIEQSATQEGVKADLIRAVINQESGGRPCAVSSKGAQGLMQLMPATSAQFGLGDPFEPRQNVEAGTKLLKQLIAKYKGDVALALSAYNAGETRVDREGGVPAIPETMQYVTSILARLPKK